MPRLSTAAQAKRNAEIVRDRARGLRWSTISSRHGLTQRQAQNIWAARRDEEHEQRVDPDELVLDEVASLDAAIEELALFAESTANDSVRLGAIKARIDA